MANQPPIVTGGDFVVDQNGWVRASSLFSVIDPDIGDSITRYDFVDDTALAGSSYFWVNGTTFQQGFANLITVSAADLATVWLHGGANIGTQDTLEVRAFDNSGSQPSEWGLIRLTTQAPSVGANIFRGGSGNDALAGTPGDDILYGNDGNDTLNGNARNDFLDGGAGLDIARFSGLMSSYTITRVGTSGTVSGPDGTDNFSSIERLQFDDNTLALAVPKNDFGGDGKSDILWHNVNGQLSMWQMDGQTLVSAGAVVSIPPAWQIGGGGDFNGDGKSDILWRHTSGAVAEWNMDGTTLASGGLVAGGGAVPSDWEVAGVGDFGGDGKSDILWHHTSGQLSLWQMDGQTLVSAAAVVSIPPAWQIGGVGDFNGDGKSDILWRHTSGAVAEWNMDGTTLVSGGLVAGGGAVPADWQVAGVGDFGGDGKSDILWHHTSGQLSMWQMDGSTLISAGAVVSIPTAWQVAGVADFNGDGKSDILWRHTSGAVAEWNMDGTTLVSGGLVAGGAAIPADWIIT